MTSDGRATLSADFERASHHPAVRTIAKRLAHVAPRRSDWTHVRWGRDLTAGVMVAMVALPLALGFGVTSGVGAAAGLATAIIAGAVAAIFGGSRVQVSGPTGAMTVVLMPIVAHQGVDAVLIVGLLAGVILVVLGLTGAGKAVRYIPVSVVEGFTVGIAATIALQQLPAALGNHAKGDRVLTLAANAIRSWVDHPAVAPLALSLGVVAATTVLARFRPSIPGSLIALALATAIAHLFGLPAQTLGDIPSGLPLPHLPHVALGTMPALLVPAAVVAGLAALESLLSATVADAMSVGQRHNPNRELFGQGLANLAAPLFGGVPATAAIARTAVNIRAGATSRLAALTHAVVLLVVATSLTGSVGKIPTAALAGVLIATALRMVRVSSLRSLLSATRTDATVLVITAAATVLFDLVTAVVVGMVIAGIFAIQQTASSAQLQQTPLDETDHDDEERRLLENHIVAYRLDGPLFFAAAHDFLLDLATVADVKVVILRMSHLTAMDATGAHVLADTITDLRRRGIEVVLAGLQPQHEQILASVTARTGLLETLPRFATTPEAIAGAHSRLVAASSIAGE